MIRYSCKECLDGLYELGQFTVTAESFVGQEERTLVHIDLCPAMLNILVETIGKPLSHLLIGESKGIAFQLWIVLLDGQVATLIENGEWRTITIERQVEV